MIRKNLFRGMLFAGILSLCSCHSGKKESLAGGEAMDINVVVDDDLYQGIDSVLVLDKLVRLESEPLLASIDRLVFAGQRIFLTDGTSRLFCYDMDGKFLYKIDAVGNGPGEYTELSFFTVDTEKKEIAVYDRRTATLLFYAMDQGKFLRKEDLKAPNPTDMCYFDGLYYYDSRYHFNYPDRKELHYSLLVSPDGKNISQSYFPHDEAEHAFEFSPSATRFYHSGSSLLYCKDFDHVIYGLRDGEVPPRYRLNLPNPLPKEAIERKIDIVELLRSDYSHSISGVYECNGVLSFRFHQKRAILFALYDLKNGRQLYCGKSLMKEPGQDVPLICFIEGVHDGRFASVLSPEFIGYHIQKDAGLVDRVLPGYNPEADNPVIALYRVKDF